MKGTFGARRCVGNAPDERRITRTGGKCMKIAASNVEMGSAHYSKTVTRESYQKGTIIGGLFNEAILKNMTGQKREDDEEGEKDSFELSKDEAYDNTYSFTPSSMQRLNKANSTPGLLENQVKSLHEMLVAQIISFMEKLFEAKHGSGDSPLSKALNTMRNGLTGGTAGYLVSYEQYDYYYHEEEETSFSGKGQAITEDGRVIDFNLSFGVSRSFTEEIGITRGKQMILTDPLVINFGDSGLTEISDQTFFFDIDSDGKDDEIHSLGKGSGFLALDKDGNGTIDNGSELFGTKSGDGFSDLEEYDSDHNGWIDENDEIYEKLKIWCKDENGNDALLSLKEADIGAIFLDRKETPLTDRSFRPEDDFSVKGMIRKTGLFLHESGKAGTIQQIDLAKKIQSA